MPYQKFLEKETISLKQSVKNNCKHDTLKCCRCLLIAYLHRSHIYLIQYYAHIYHTQKQKRAAQVKAGLLL